MVNKKNKDRLFSFIFGREDHKDWTLSLYNTVNGSKYEDSSEIEINTLEDTLYMGMKNDVSFILRMEMSLYEHQSTYNPNMPLRELMYAGLLYDKYVHKNHKNIYGRNLIELPVPKLVVFYNGTEDADDEVILELKDAFPEKAADRSDIQVRVRMLNINYGRNKSILDACEPLMGYSWFVERVRKHKFDGLGVEDSVDAALAEMPDTFSIKPYLMENKAEVRAMCLTEYNEVETMEMFKEEGREEGVKALVKLCKKFNGGMLDAIESVVSEMKINQTDAEILVKKYW